MFSLKIHTHIKYSNEMFPFQSFNRPLFILCARFWEYSEYNNTSCPYKAHSLVPKTFYVYFETSVRIQLQNPSPSAQLRANLWQTVGLPELLIHHFLHVSELYIFLESHLFYLSFLIYWYKVVHTIFLELKNLPHTLLFPFYIFLFKYSFSF